MTVALITHPHCHLHANGSPYHPECAARLDAINNRLIMSGVDWIARHYDAQRATPEQLQRVHTAAYVQHVFASAPAQGLIELDGDTHMNPHSLDAALHAAGAAVLAVDLVMAGTHQHAFCSIRRYSKPTQFYL